jgi:hypothetical protein
MGIQNSGIRCGRRVGCVKAMAQNDAGVEGSAASWKALDEGSWL